MCLAKKMRNSKTTLQEHVITEHPAYIPENCLGWSCYEEILGCEEFGYFCKETPCNQLYLYPLCESDIKYLYTIVRRHFVKSGKPWKVAFITKKSESVFVRKFNTLTYKNLARFRTDNTVFDLHTLGNHLSNIVDPIIFRKLECWIQQFEKYNLFSQPISNSIPRRSILPYFNTQIPEESTILSQPYMKYLYPQSKIHIPIDDSIDPTLSLIGFHPTQHYHPTELSNMNKLIEDIYKSQSNKYKEFKNKMKSYKR